MRIRARGMHAYVHAPDFQALRRNCACDYATNLTALRAITMLSSRRRMPSELPHRALASPSRRRSPELSEYFPSERIVFEGAFHRSVHVATRRADYFTFYFIADQPPPHVMISRRSESQVDNQRRSGSCRCRRIFDDYNELGIVYNNAVLDDVTRLPSSRERRSFCNTVQ